MFTVEDGTKKIIVTYKQYELFQQLCTLIHKKCFFKQKSRSTFCNSSNMNTSHQFKPKYIFSENCDNSANGKKFSFTVLPEALSERTPTLTAFVFQIQEEQSSAKENLYACLPLIKLP